MQLYKILLTVFIHLIKLYHITAHTTVIAVFTAGCRSLSGAQNDELTFYYLYDIHDCIGGMYAYNCNNCRTLDVQNPSPLPYPNIILLLDSVKGNNHFF